MMNLGDIIGALDQIRKKHEAYCANKETRNHLHDRLLAIQPSLERLRSNNVQIDDNSLALLENTVKMTENVLDRIFKPTYFAGFWRWVNTGTYAKNMKECNKSIDRSINVVNLALNTLTAENTQDLRVQVQLQEERRKEDKEDFNYILKTYLEEAADTRELAWLLNTLDEPSSTPPTHSDSSTIDDQPGNVKEGGTANDTEDTEIVPLINLGYGAGSNVERRLCFLKEVFSRELIKLVDPDRTMMLQLHFPRVIECFRNPACGVVFIDNGHLIEHCRADGVYTVRICSAETMWQWRNLESHQRGYRWKKVCQCEAVCRCGDQHMQNESHASNFPDYNMVLYEYQNGESDVAYSEVFNADFRDKARPLLCLVSGSTARLIKWPKEYRVPITDIDIPSTPQLPDTAVPLCLVETTLGFLYPFVYGEAFFFQGNGAQTDNVPFPIRPNHGGEGANVCARWFGHPKVLADVPLDQVKLARLRNSKISKVISREIKFIYVSHSTSNPTFGNEVIPEDTKGIDRYPQLIDGVKIWLEARSEKFKREFYKYLPLLRQTLTDPNCLTVVLTTNNCFVEHYWYADTGHHVKVICDTLKYDRRELWKDDNMYGWSVHERTPSRSNEDREVKVKFTNEFFSNLNFRIESVSDNVYLRKWEPPVPDGYAV